MSSRPNFRPIAPPLPVPDDALAQLADKLGVPALVNPASDPTIAGQIPAADASEPESRPAPRQKRDKPASAQKKRPAVETMKFSAQIPLYVSRAINQRAALDGCTVRHLLLLGMRAIGIAIEDADLIPDGRRPKK